MKIQEKIITDEILEKLELGNFYKILNQNIFPLLKEEEQTFVKELEDFCIELAPKIDREKDVYVLFPKLGEHGYIQRMNKYKDFTPYGMKYEVLLGTILSICDPQLDLARLASGILCGNPTYQHGETDEILKVQADLMEGKGVGCIMITEPERGSDAVNMTTICEKVDDGVIFNGEKIFTTNGPKADYFVGYGVYDVKDPRGTMVQAMFKKEFGIRTERLLINSAPRVHIAHTYLENVKVPYPYILGDNGKGYNYLFDGLVPERISIVGSSLGICWNGLIHGLIYSNLRKQFNKNIISYQGIGFPLADLFTKVTAATMMSFQIASIYDDKILFVEKPTKEIEKWMASLSSQIKYYGCKLSHEVCYEVQNHMGGISLTDNTLIDEAMNTSKVEEVIGGTRNVQLLIVQNSIRRMFSSIL